MTMELMNPQGEVIKTIEEGKVFGYYVPARREVEWSTISDIRELKHAFPSALGKGFRTSLDVAYGVGDMLQIADGFFLIGK